MDQAKIDIKINTKLEKLIKHKNDWYELSREKRIDLLSMLLLSTKAQASDWVRLSCEHKGIDFNSNTAGEEWLNGPVAMIRYLRLLRNQILERQKSLCRLKTQKVGDQVSVRVFPQNLWEKLFLPGVSARLWTIPGADIETLDPGEHKEHTKAGISLVLGAGNVSSIAPLDVLHKLFVEDQVVVLKMNPVNDYLGPILEKIFEAFVLQGFVEFIYGGAEVGKYLSENPLIDSIHMTGSIATHDKIVWGETEKLQKERKASNRPKINKAMTSELGCVTPIIVVPGAWSERELNYQARNIASMLVNNAGFNCAAGKVLVTHKEWPLRAKFLNELKLVLASLPPRKAYYPGSFERFESFKQAYPEAQELSSKQAQSIGWSLVTDLEAKMSGEELIFDQELFCGVMAEVPIACAPVDFFKSATDFANNRLFGTLSCNIIIDKKSENKYRKHFNKMLDELCYGGIAINIWSGTLYWLMSTTWGAYPGHTLRDVQSGIGWVHNTFMIKDPQKCILKAPFIMRPTPSWFSDNKNLKNIGKQMLNFEFSPGLTAYLKLVVEGLKG